jgi:hypothetical protein
MAQPIQIEADFALLLTASVDPKGMPGVTRPDPHARESDYAACLRYYVAQHPRVRKIVFVENSAWPLDRFRETVATHNTHGKQVEFISLNCNDFPRHLGKSYGEFLLLDEAMNASELAASARLVGKLTGRNYLLNLTDILQRAPETLGLLMDIRDHGIYEFFRIPFNGRHADTRLLVFTHEFYERFIRGRYKDLDDSKPYMAEDLFYDLAKRGESAPRVIRRLPIEPDYRGLAGHWNKDYGSFREVTKRRIRGVTRRVAPWLHI